MRIAFITFEYPPFIIGGAGVYALKITAKLAKLGHQVVVFTPDMSNQNVILNSDSFNSDFPQIVKVPVSNKLPFKALQFWLNLPKEIKKFEKEMKFDIVHINGISYWFLKRLSNAKHVITIHHLVRDAMIHNKLSFISKIKNVSGENGFFLPLIEHKCIKSSDSIVAVSNFTKEQIVCTYQIECNKIKVIHNGVDCKDYSYTKNEMEKAKKQVKLTEIPMILFVGRVDDPRKGLPFLLCSFKNVLTEVDARLVVVGKGDQTEARNVASSLDISENVIFSDFVDEEKLNMYYLSCDVYVCSSNLEGFGLTILESMVAKKPVVATNVGAIPEIIIDGFNGILVEFGDTERMANAICKFLKDPKLSKEVGEQNWRYVYEKFSWDRSVNDLVNLYVDI